MLVVTRFLVSRWKREREKKNHVVDVNLYEKVSTLVSTVTDVLPIIEDYSRSNTLVANVSVRIDVSSCLLWKNKVRQQYVERTERRRNEKKRTNKYARICERAHIYIHR